MIHKRINPEDYPPKKGESWWVVHPNSKNEFRVPMGAVTVCCPVEDNNKEEKVLSPFVHGTVYPIVGVDNHNGWITLRCGDDLYDMPQYLFVRHFDSDVFIIGAHDPVELERAKPFDYRSTVPKNFRDGEE